MILLARKFTSSVKLSESLMAAHTTLSPILSLLRTPPTATDSHRRRSVAFTTPSHYAERLSNLLLRRDWTPVWCPTVVVEPTPLTHSNLLHFLSPPSSVSAAAPLESFSAIAFTSRAGITAFTAAMEEASPPPILSPVGDVFTVAALGQDAELLDRGFLCRICARPERVRVLVPPTASPSGLVESLGPGRGRSVLCPVPRVVALEEPSVVPDFLRQLGLIGWAPVRVDGYVTRWAGPNCLRRLVGDEGQRLDAVVFTSTAEVEGMLKGLKEFGLSWAEFRSKWAGLVVAAHGPVTAKGAERLGVTVDVVGSRFGSFDGVVEALSNALGE